MNAELYICVENLNLTTPQQNTLLNFVVGLGQGYMYPSPVRKDNKAGIFEARFRTGDLTQYPWKVRLGSAFSVDPSTIDIYEASPTFGDGSSDVFVFSRLGVDYFTVTIFGGIGSSKEHSASECRSYLQVNSGAWS